jgi:hypothetical protein
MLCREVLFYPLTDLVDGVGELRELCETEMISVLCINLGLCVVMVKYCLPSPTTCDERSWFLSSSLLASLAPLGLKRVLCRLQQLMAADSVRPIYVFLSSSLLIPPPTPSASGVPRSA